MKSAISSSAIRALSTALVDARRCKGAFVLDEGDEGDEGDDGDGAASARPSPDKNVDPSGEVSEVNDSGLLFFFAASIAAFRF